MTNVEAAALIVGIAMPALVSILKQAGLSRRWNLLIAIVACVGAGVLTAYATGQLTGSAVIVATAIVFSVAQATYQAFWKGTDAERLLNESTSIVKGEVD